MNTSDLPSISQRGAASTQLTDWQKLLRCLAERRLPGQAKNLIPRLLSRATGKTVVASRRGRKKFLKFDLADRPMADLILGEIFNAEVYFPVLTAWQRFNISRGDTVIDIGANVGLFAVCAANLSRTGKVFCFEPSKDNFTRLEFHKTLNGMNNIVAVHKGISDKEENLNLYLVDENCGAHSIIADEKDRLRRNPTNCEMIECISLKQVFDRYDIDHCDFLKIDCEGAELRILSALPAEYFKRIRRVALEYHTKVNVLELAELLHSHGFSVTIKGYPVKWGLLFASRE